MAVNERTLKSANRLDRQKIDSTPRKLKIPQLATILVLLFFNTQLLDNLPAIGPLTPTMLMELLAFFMVMPWLPDYLRNLDARDKFLFFVGACMFALGLVNFSGEKGLTHQKNIFTSMYAYFFVVCFFSNRPEYDVWLKRLYLFPAFATIYSIGSNVFSTVGTINLDTRIGDNYSAAYLTLIVPICWVQFQRERGLFRFLNFIVLIATPIVLVVTASRTSFVILAVVTIAMLFVKTPGKKSLIFMISILVFLTLFFLLPRQSVFTSRVATLQDPFAALNVDRISLWKAALLSIKEHPLLGGNFRANVQRLVLEAAPDSNYARHIMYGVASGNFGVHNGYLAVVVDFGIIVGFLYLGFFFSLGKSLFRTQHAIRDEANRIFLIAGLISLIGYAISSLAYHNYMGQNYFIIWAILQCSIKNSRLKEGIQVAK